MFKTLQVGIYKTQNATKSITIDPRAFVSPAENVAAATAETSRPALTA